MQSEKKPVKMGTQPLNIELIEALTIVNEMKLNWEAVKSQKVGMNSQKYFLNE